MAEAHDDLRVSPPNDEGSLSPDDAIQEGAAEIAAFVAAGTGVVGVGLGAAQTFYARASYELQREEAATRAAERAEYAALQRQLYEEQRRLAYEQGGLAGLDEFDEWHYDGPFLGFAVDGY
jgi:hypothetical protein